MSFLTLGLAQRPILIGLTGGIGSGKSTVARIFEAEGVPTISSDEIVHKLYAENHELQNFLIKEFGTLKRKEIARLVFGNTKENKQRRILLESKIHPLVEEKLRDWIIENQAYPLLVNDVPLLFEAKLEKRFDYIIVVNADTETRLQRLMKRNSELSEIELMERINAQMPLAEKVKKANFVINNNSGIENLQKQISRLIQEIRI